MILCLWLSYEKKYGEKNFFFCFLKVTEERSRIRSWIRIRAKKSRILNTAFAYPQLYLVSSTFCQNIGYQYLFSSEKIANFSVGAQLWYAIVKFTSVYYRKHLKHNNIETFLEH
jgi:hypothetical protein